MNWKKILPIYLMGSEEENKRQAVKDTLKMAGIMAVTIFVAEYLRIKGYGSQNQIMVYILAVVIISRLTSNFIYGFVAALISTFIYDLLITTPRLGFSFTIGFPFTLFVMLFVTFITSTITMQMKNQARLATDREHRTQLLYEMNQKLLVARDIDTIIQLALEYLVNHLHRAAIFYFKEPYMDSGAYTQMSYNSDSIDIFHTNRQKEIVSGIFRSSGVIDPSEIPDDPQVRYVPIASKGQLLGLIGVSCKVKPLSQGNMTFIRTLSGQVTLALELQYISDEQSHILVEAEREKMRSNLLRAISHDLRTPLTSILGASSTILEQKDMPRETELELIGNIQENSQWLIRMVENILTVTRISTETMKVQKTVEAAEEIVAQAVSIVRKRFPAWTIHVGIPEDLLMVPMDATLVCQVLINLMENAIKNSPEGSEILVNLRRESRKACFTVSDQGSGIPDQVMENLFGVHTPGRVSTMDAARGIGIGLSICQTIIQAHSGSIEGHNKKDGGAEFIFWLPLREEYHE